MKVKTSGIFVLLDEDNVMFVKVPGIKIVDNVIKNNNKIIFNNETSYKKFLKLKLKS